MRRLFAVAVLVTSIVLAWGPVASTSQHVAYACSVPLINGTCPD